MVASRGAAADAPPAGPALRTFQTPYYLIHTDLPAPDAAEAVVRLRVLGDAYRARTRAFGFTGRITQRLPVYLFNRRADYLATGAPPESAGAFLGDRLVVAARPEQPGAAPAWHVVQHEAFHQFAAAVKGPDLPGWLNEGLGEYFGEALFTGDGHVGGVIPAWRAARVKDSLADGSFMPLARLLRMSQAQWNEKVTLANYDQAWSVVQFILQGGEGTDITPLATFVRALADAQDPDDAWREAFGEVDSFERRWRAYWETLPRDPTPGRYAEAAAAAATSVVACAAAAGQTFDGFDALLEAARGGQLQHPPGQWLPPSLLLRATEWAPKGSSFSLDGQGRATRVVLSLRDGTRWVGTFAARDGQAPSVTVHADPSDVPRR